jgi:uracil-DNA glycosylase family 4
MKGFFTQKETESTTRPDGKVYSCHACGLHQGCKSPKMQPYGRFKEGILIVGGLLNKLEDTKGSPWQGPSGNLLKDQLKEMGIDLFRDCLSTSAMNCHVGDSKLDTPYQVASCRRFALELIKKYKPKVIILFGNLALSSLIGYRWKKDMGTISQWRGWVIPDQDHNAWICPMNHPDEVLKGDKELLTIWKSDLQRALDHKNNPCPKAKKPLIEYITDLNILKRIKSNVVAFDYETTGLKPHASGHRIVCASIAYNEYCAYAFMMPPSRTERQPFIDLLANNLIGKMAHNMKFEETWSTVKLRQTVNNWAFDSMQAAHVLDNRPGITGLKFQTYVRFGVIDYASEVSPYLKAVDSKNGNAINRIMELVEQPGGAEKLLEYCALDSIYEFRLAKLQMAEMNYELTPF